MKMKNEKRYKIICPSCGRVQYACKSILQKMGLSVGYAACFYCNEMMQLIYCYETDSMTAEELKID